MVPPITHQRTNAAQGGLVIGNALVSINEVVPGFSAKIPFGMPVSIEVDQTRKSAWSHEVIMRRGHTEISHAGANDPEEGAVDLRLNVAVVLARHS